MKRNNNLVYFSALIILSATFIFLLDDNELYGNDKESIVKIIKSIESYEKDSIEILEIKDIYDKRVVSFLSKNSPAYIEFYKNPKGNYEWKHIEKSEGKSFASYIIKSTSDQSNIFYLLIITNEENNIAKFKLNVNRQVIEQKLSLNKKASKWVELPKPKSNSYAFQFKYYDKENRLLAID